MKTDMCLSKNFPFVFSILKCFYNNENISLENYKLKFSDNNNGTIVDDCVVLPNSDVESNSIRLIDIMLSEACAKKNNLDKIQLNNFYAFAIGIIKYTYSNSYLKSFSDIEISSSLKRETFYLPSSLFFDIVCPVFDISHSNKLDLIFSKKIPYEVCIKDNCAYLSMMNMHNPIGDFITLDSIIYTNDVCPKNVFNKLISKNQINNIFFSSIRDFYQDDFSFALFIFMCCMKYDISYNFDYSILHSEIGIKTAKKYRDPPFWIFGLIEKMLESHRGPDFTVKMVWDPYVAQTYKMIEDARREKKISGTTLEFMLRVLNSNEDGKKDLIEKVLEDNRYEK
jgi:hypothetical protein